MIRPRTIAEGVELFPARTPTLPPATHTNSYALGEREIALIEPATPYADEQRAWLEWARGLQSSGRSIIAILLTHHHADHVGGAGVFSRELSAPIWAHEATAARVPYIKVSRHLADGEVLTLNGPEPSTWRVLHTPGHAVGHLCFHDESRGILIAGDMVASVGTILIEPTEGDMIEYLAQLERLAKLAARVALPAHGEPIEEPEALFRHYIHHREMREAKVIEALGPPGAAPVSLDSLLSLVYADTSPLLWPIARLSLEAHLLKLEREGRARRTGGIWAASG